MAGTPPDDILGAVRIIRKLREKTYLSRDEKVEMNRAKLRVAYWACRSESIVASRETLSYILGGDAAEIMSHYERYLQKEKDKDKQKGGTRRIAPKGAPGGGDDSTFWNGA